MNVLHLSLEYPKVNSFVPQASNNVYLCANPTEELIQKKKAIRIPRGEFSLTKILDKSEFIPDLVSISSSLALLKNTPVPKGIESLNCPTVLKFTDSHHMHNPIRKLIEYAKSVNCQYHWTTYNRNHVHFYKEAGLSNVFWMPGSISTPYIEVKKQEVKFDVGFCGSLEGVHPTRKKFISFLRENNVNVHVERRSYAGSLELYNASKIAFNCSLNGDLNRRVFETLMAGGFLMTDRLSQQSGMFELFQEGEHIECYKDENELLEKVKYYLAHPEKSEQISKAGHDLFMKEYHPEIINQQFYNYLLGNGPINPTFMNVLDQRTNSGKTVVHDNALEKRICLYEIIQELHKENATVSIHVIGGEKEIVTDIADLPRARIFYSTTNENPETSRQYFAKAGTGHVVVQDTLPEEIFDVVVLNDELTAEKSNRFIQPLKMGRLIISPKTFKGNASQVQRLGYKSIIMVEPESNRVVGNDYYYMFQKVNLNKHEEEFNVVTRGAWDFVQPASVFLKKVIKKLLNR